MPPLNLSVAEWDTLWDLIDNVVAGGEEDAEDRPRLEAIRVKLARETPASPSTYPEGEGTE